VWEAIGAASTNPLGYLRFTPGPGVGGHCLPIDPSYLSWRVRQSLGHAFRFVELANDVNDHMPDYVVARLTEALNDRGVAVKGRTILLVGLAYKRNTGDARETPARPIARRLRELGATVLAVDPHVAEDQVPDGVRQVALDTHVAQTADAVVLLVDHDAVDLDLLADHAAYVLDTRRALPASTRVEYL
jgi:UDP-N-acetyl-D-glucosamine dehydrogenase